MHTDAMKGLAKNHWLPYFGPDKLVEDLDQDELDDFFFYLYTVKGLSGSTVNHAITCGSKAIGYLFDKRKISFNPMAGAERYGISNEKRDIPTESEVRSLLNLDWRNHLGKLAFELAAYCGLRAGEISGLRVCDLDMQAEVLHIRHSWNEKDGYVEEECVEFVHQMYRGVRFITDLELQRAFEKHLIKSESFRRIQSLIGLLKMSKTIKVRDCDLDNDSYLFNTDKVTLDLKNGKGLPPDPKHLSTKKSSFVYKNDAKCPTWDKFLMQIFDNDFDLIHFVQKAMGYALCGDVKEQCIFILWGTGANGKSTFLNTLQKLFGDYACSTATETFMKKTSEQSNDLARLKGMRLVTTTEIEQGKAISESLIKQITGGDMITARFLYGEFFSFIPTFKIFMATNHKPKIRGSDNGIWRRIKMIPFTVTIPPKQRDGDLGKKLLAENSGILNWLIQGFKMWKKEGLCEEPDAIKNANEEYRMDMDSVGMFIMECFTIDASMKIREGNTQVYNTYLKWCTKNNERALSQKSLTIRMQEKGFKRCVSNSQRFWLGLVMKNEWRS